MTAAMLLLEPIFEADLPDEQYAYRSCRNAQQAVFEVHDHLYHGHPDVVDADLADYFGTISHTELLKSVARRIVDRRVLHLAFPILPTNRHIEGLRGCLSQIAPIAISLPTHQSRRSLPLAGRA